MRRLSPPTKLEPSLSNTTIWSLLPAVNRRSSPSKARTWKTSVCSEPSRTPRRLSPVSTSSQSDTQYRADIELHLGLDENAKVVIIGTSFIGMELAGAVLKKKPASIDVVGVDAVPFAKILGEKIGGAILKVSCETYQQGLETNAHVNFLRCRTWRARA
jgi:hypothetical protein